jgi:hypothetical protein
MNSSALYAPIASLCGASWSYEQPRLALVQVASHGRAMMGHADVRALSGYALGDLRGPERDCASLQSMIAIEPETSAITSHAPSGDSFKWCRGSEH